MKILIALMLLIPSLSWSYDKDELVCISAYSLGRDVFEAQGDNKSFKILTDYQKPVIFKNMTQVISQQHMLMLEKY